VTTRVERHALGQQAGNSLVNIAITAENRGNTRRKAGLIKMNAAFEVLLWF
jgi:hypothetical protein